MTCTLVYRVLEEEDKNVTGGTGREDRQAVVSLHLAEEPESEAQGPHSRVLMNGEGGDSYLHLCHDLLTSPVCVAASSSPT